MTTINEKLIEECYAWLAVNTEGMIGMTGVEHETHRNNGERLNVTVNLIKFLNQRKVTCEECNKPNCPERSIYERAVRSKKQLPGDYTFESLVKRAIRNAKPSKAGDSERWVAVMDTFATGSTFAHDLCRFFELDPDKKVHGVHCIACNP